MEKQKLWAVLCGVLAVSIVGVLFIGNAKVSDLRITHSKNQSEISQLEADLAEMKEKLDYVPQVKLDEEEQEQVSHSAAELGDAVAGYQNAYAALSASGDRDAFQANVDALDICFTDTSKAARVPWYSGKRPGNWEFVTDGQFKGVNKEVLWLCKSSEDGSLLAYATGVYDSESNLFMDVNFQMSVLGNSEMEPTGEASELIDQNAVNGLAEELSKVETPTERELTEEETTEVKDAQQQLKDLMTKQQNEAEGGTENEN